MKVITTVIVVMKVKAITTAKVIVIEVMKL
jgi:hypothetical protein